MSSSSVKRSPRKVTISYKAARIDGEVNGIGKEGALLNFLQTSPYL
jgi:hypothetical protein